MKYAILFLHAMGVLTLLTPVCATCAESNKVDERTPLMIAAESGEPGKVRNLLEDGADWTTTYKGETALIMAKRKQKETKKSRGELSYMRNNNKPWLTWRYYETQRNYQSVIDSLKKKEPGCFDVLLHKIKSVLSMSTV